MYFSLRALCLLLGLTSLGAHAQTPTFAPVATYGTGGSEPINIAVADVNGDGKPDLLTANYSSSTLGVLLGTGTGSFQAATTYSTGSGSGPTSIAVADVNGDGQLDLLTANYGSNTVGVLLGTGTGSFQAATTYSTGPSSDPIGIAVADVNGDGQLDLLTANLSNTVGVLLGTGTGTFQAATTYGTGPNSRPYSIAVADVNGDGKLDLLTANSISSTAGVLLGTGTGTFQAATTYGTGPNSRPYSIAVADVNGDGKLDLLTANLGNGTASVLLGTGNGTFQAATTYGTGGSSVPQSIAVADVNGDGKLDLLVANGSSSTAGVLLGTGTGTFQAATTYGTGGSNPRSIAVADVNGDGKLDLLTANSNSNNVGVLLNTTVYAPTVTTAAATSITNNSAVLGGNVTADGGAAVTDRGVVYSTTNATPTISDTKDANGSGTGSFSKTISGLATGTAYYVRAYATNSAGTSYGGVQTFTTPTFVSLLFSSGSQTRNSSGPIIYTLTFKDNVSGVSLSNFALTTSGSVQGASVVSVSGSGNSYSVTVNTGTGDGTLRLDLANATGISPVPSNVPFRGALLTIDNTRPTVAVSSSAGASGGTTGTSPIPVTVTFSEPVMGFGQGSVSVTNGTVSSFAGSGASYSFNVTPTTPGTATTVSVAANVAQDQAANGNTASNSYSLTYIQPITAAPVVTAPANGSFVNSTTPTYSGTAPAGSTVTVYVDGASLGTTLTNASGSFSLAQPTALAQGSHTVRATAQSSGQAVSQNSNTNTFTVTLAPTVSSFTPTQGAVGTSVTLTGTDFTGATAVRFGTINAPTFSVTSNTSLTVTVPAGVVLAPISVLTPGGASRYVGAGNGLFAVPACTATAQVTPAGPLSLPAGGSATLTATATTPGFNVQGSGFDGNVNAVAVQPDGKVLVGGDFTSYNGKDAPDGVLRLNADGSLDNTFNNGGAGAGSDVYALAVQPDGKVLVGGILFRYNGKDAPDRVLRLNADGSLDNTFNNGGAGADLVVYALAVQADGKVLIGGGFTSYNGNAAAPDYVLRLNADGSLDTSFNTSGTGSNQPVQALAVQADGKVLIGGGFTAYNGNPAAPDDLLRLNADGSLDNTFNNAGVGANNPPVLALAVQADGKVLVGGNFTSYNGNAAAPHFVLRLNADGSLDNTFNNGGAGANNPPVLALAVQADGKVLVGGNFTSYNGNAAAPDYVLRLNADGSLDTSFNNGGTGANSTVNALAVQADGKVLVGGGFTAYNGNPAAPDDLLRLNADGSLNNAATPLTGATFVFNPGNTAGNTRTVNAAGTYTATATDPASGCTYTSNAVVVTVAPTIAVAPATLPDGTVGAAYSQTITASGGTAPYAFAISAGALPAGLTLTPAGVLAGTPTAGGTFSFTVTATDASPAPGPYSGSRAYSLTIGSQPVTAAPVVSTPANNSSVNTTTPTYSGTAPAGSTVTVYVDGAAVGSTTATAGSFSLAQPTALAQGPHTVYARAQTNGAAVSGNSNPNNFTVDTVAPTVAISSSAGASGSTTGTSPIPFTVTFSEPVTGFMANGVTVSNGTLAGFAGSGASYTFNVTPTTAGTATTVSVAANQAQDAASNGNTASTTYALTYSQPVAPAPTAVTVLYENGDGNPTNSSVDPFLQLVNTTTAAIPYQELTVRYYLTVDNFSPLRATIGYAELGTSGVQARYVALPQPAQGALGYIEYSFTSPKSLAAGGNSGRILSHISKQNYSAFNEADDYSYGTNTSSYVATDHITVYRNGTLVGGVEPGPMRAAVQLQAQSGNLDTNASTNSLSIVEQVRNLDNAPVAYQDLTLRYWFTPDGTTPLHGTVGYAQLGSSNMSLTLGQAGTQTYAELHFAASLGNLAPLTSSGQIILHVNKQNYANFTQTNDYSFRADNMLVANPHVTVYWQGQLVYGQEPDGAQGAPASAVANALTTDDGPATQLNLTPVFEAYPNPFGEQTALHFRAASSGPARLVVYNSLGQVVQTCLEGPAEAGRDYYFPVAGAALASGVYLARLQVEGRVQTLRLVLNH